MSYTSGDEQAARDALVEKAARTPMTDKTREKTPEEQIAEGLYTRMNPASKFLLWDELDVGGKAREVWVAEAKFILAIPGIEEGQKLREKAKSGVLVELDDDQSMPPALYHGGDAFTEEAVKSDMVRGGFRRVKVKG